MPSPAHRRVRVRPVSWVIAGAALTTEPALALPQSGDSFAGLWFFAGTALILVAVLAFWLGRALERGATDPNRADEPARTSIQGQGATSTPGKDEEIWLALAQFAPPDLHVSKPGPCGSRQLVRPLRHQASVDPAAPPSGWQEAASGLSAGSRIEFHGWVLCKLEPDGKEYLLAWPGGTAVAPGEMMQAEDAAAEAVTFSYTVSHDLRAPLRVVEGFARILKEDYGRQFDRIGNDHLDRVLAAAARMNTMIDAMLSMAKLSSQPLARQPVDLSQIAQFVVEDLRRTSPQRAIEVNIEPELRVVGDPRLLRQVLENLLSNAWKYTGHCETARIGLSSRQQDGRKVFEVRDNGAGFDMRSADRLFGLFQRLHSQSEFPGTGVGLASVQRIVRRHGGDIWAEAAPGQGACFSFTLGA